MFETTCERTKNYLLDFVTSVILYLTRNNTDNIYQKTLDVLKRAQKTFRQKFAEYIEKAKSETISAMVASTMEYVHKFGIKNNEVDFYEGKVKMAWETYETSLIVAINAAVVFMFSAMSAKLVRKKKKYGLPKRQNFVKPKVNTRKTEMNLNQTTKTL